MRLYPNKRNNVRVLEKAKPVIKTKVKQNRHSLQSNLRFSSTHPKIQVQRKNIDEKLWNSDAYRSSRESCEAPRPARRASQHLRWCWGSWGAHHPRPPTAKRSTMSSPLPRIWGNYLSRCLVGVYFWFCSFDSSQEIMKVMADLPRRNAAHMFHSISGSNFSSVQHYNAASVR